MAFSSASACASVSGAGSAIGRLRGDAARHDGLDQRAARGRADDGQHVRSSAASDADVAGNELGGVLEFGQRLVGGHQHGELPVACGWRSGGEVQAFLTSSS